MYAMLKEIKQDSVIFPCGMLRRRNQKDKHTRLVWCGSVPGDQQPVRFYEAIRAADLLRRGEKYAILSLYWLRAQLNRTTR